MEIFLKEFVSSINPIWASFFGVIVGSFFTGIYNHFNNSRLKEIEFRNAFYTKLIEKRLKLYEELEAIVEPFLRVNIIEGKAYATLILEPDEFKIYHWDIEKFKPKARWLGENTQHKFDNLTAALLYIRNNIVYAKNDARKLHQLAQKERKNLQNLSYDVLDSLYDDYFELHNIQAPKKKPKYLRLNSPKIARLDEPQKPKVQE